MLRCEGSVNSFRVRPHLAVGPEFEPNWPRNDKSKHNHKRGTYEPFVSLRTGPASGPCLFVVCQLVALKQIGPVLEVMG